MGGAQTSKRAQCGSLGAAAEGTAVKRIDRVKEEPKELPCKLHNNNHVDTHERDARS